MNAVSLQYLLCSQAYLTDQIDSITVSINMMAKKVEVSFFDGRSNYRMSHTHLISNLLLDSFGL